MKCFLRIRIWTGCFLRYLRQKVRSELPLLTVWGAAQMEGAWEAADELTRNVLENWDTNQIHDAGYREELKRQFGLCISVCGRTAFFR
mgnify:CR=1 FL=1